MQRRVFVIVNKQAKEWGRLEFVPRPDLPGGLTREDWRKVYGAKREANRQGLRWVDCGVN
jgi:hypothetical protein